MDRVPAARFAIMVILFTLCVISYIEAGKCSGRWAIHACAGGSGKRSRNPDAFRWSDFFGLDESRPKRRSNEVPERTEKSQNVVDEQMPNGVWMDDHGDVQPPHGQRNERRLSVIWPFVDKQVMQRLMMAKNRLRESLIRAEGVPSEFADNDKSDDLRTQSRIKDE